jgi:putative transposase
MEKRFNYRIYPNEAQTEQIQKNFGCCRFVYNYYLNKRNEKYEAGEGIYSYYDACKDLTRLKRRDEYAWLRDADAHSLQSAIKNMNHAYSEFFRRVRTKSGAPGFPRFKSKRETRQSYMSKAQPGKDNILLGDRAIKLPKLGLVKCSVSRPVEGRILSASVFQVPSGKYFVSICCTGVYPKPLPKTGRDIGLHFGIRTLAVSSDGRTFENNRYLEKSQRKISRLQRRVSRKPKDSANREKARISLAKAYEHARNQKTDTLQKLTTQMVREYDTICARKEELSKMIRSRPYAYLLSDAGWGELTQLLRCKCAWYGKRYVEIEAKFPSVQLCSSCGGKNIRLAKNKAVQEWTCPECGAKHERAKNAALNTLMEGLRLVSCDT